MKRFRPLFLVVPFVIAALTLAPSPVARADASPEVKDMPPGAYQLDANHTSITFKINHLGFSRYTGRFDKMEATLSFNNGAPEQSSLNVTIYPNSINTNNAKLEEELRGEKFFD